MNCSTFTLPQVCRLVFLFAMVWGSGVVEGQVKTVDSGWEYFANPQGRTTEEAKQWVVEQAKIRAMAAAFGTRVKSETVQVSSEFNGQTDGSFTELNVLQVMGEWLSTTALEGPKPEVRNGEIWWSVRIQGKAQPMKESRVDLTLELCSDLLGLDPVTFLEAGDRVRARFQSPVDGHVMFFYIEKGVVYALSNNNAEFAEEVKGQQVYSLFSNESEWLESVASERELSRLARYAWGFQVTNENMMDAQAMLVGAFATHGFAPPNMNWEEEDQMWMVEEEKFERWIKQNAGRSDHFQVQRVPIRIRPKQRY